MYDTILHTFFYTYYITHIILVYKSKQYNSLKRIEKNDVLQ